ncbi:cellobiose dehydrogenase [Pyricularia oryzae 70-15]|uniref:Cellobiose dehydrogenase n=2 Tax=Pyricularia oryzae TaxID=318829 RepID=G4NAN3_PYRO7|nr:cellobiose dehydrogenase [Pyricularia oryzae 70-15]EHA49676.1 cellobiose dehydrogenase [Pyricularia oryzae 70-15]ELQ34909.1 cellobiose dehydrogenase [Pyricularia oryzae Y34]
MRTTLLSSLACAIAAVTAAGNSSCAGKQTYDHIVVGGGQAGIVAATRLAQTGKHVLLLERGVGPTVATGADNVLSWNDTLTPTDVPGLAPAVRDVGLFSKYMCPDTEGVSACVLGGAGSFNYLVYVHPPARDFDDRWPSGWKWSDVKPAADRVYAVNPGSQIPSADGRRYDFGLYDTLGSGFLASRGWKAVDQVAQPDEKHEAYSYPNWNIGDQKRAGSLASYLPVARQQSGFSMQLNASVSRLLREGGKVTGVEIEGGKKRFRLAEGGKVILAAGAWGTPRVLLNSGIGPAEQLRIIQNGTSGVKLPARDQWVDLPVGKTIRDHSIFTLTIQTNETFGAFNASAAAFGVSSARSDISLYNERSSGQLAQGMHKLIFWTSTDAGGDNRTRYIQGSCSPGGPGLFSIKAYLTHGLTSKGSVGIDAGGKMVFTQKPYLVDAADRRAALAFVEETVAAVKAYPGWKLQGYSNSTAVLDKIEPGNHFVGTAGMGEDKATSVVGPDAKVHGMENLYVVDASMHPDLPTGNTNAIVMVAAEAAIGKIIAQQ